MAFSILANRNSTTAKRGRFTAFVAAILRRNTGPKETRKTATEAPQELNSRLFYEREQAAKLAQAQREVNRIWY